MAEMQSTITLKFEEEHITLPSRLVTRMLEKVFDGQLASGDQPAPMHTSVRPAIGSAQDGGINAGMTIQDDAPARLVLLPGEFEGNWKDARAWAEQQGGMLPSRVDALILWQNLPGEFRKEAYWTDTRHAATPDCAWYQYFTDGYQDYGNVDRKLRARAVRRLTI